MNRIFNMDNGFFRAVSKLVDLVYLSFLFVISCIPVFTIGAAMTAMYYTVQKTIRNDRGYVGSEYWHGFKMTLQQSTWLGLAVLAAGLILYGAVRILQIMEEAGNPFGKAHMFFRVLLFLLTVWCSYIFPYMARFENNTKAILKNAAYIAVLNLPKTLLMVVYMAVTGLILYIMPIALFFMPAVFTWMQNITMEKIFRKYMSDEDRAAEDELNREYKH